MFSLYQSAANTISHSLCVEYMIIVWVMYCAHTADINQGTPYNGWPDSESEINRRNASWLFNVTAFHMLALVTDRKSASMRVCYSALMSHVILHSQSLTTRIH